MPSFPAFAADRLAAADLDPKAAAEGGRQRRGRREVEKEALAFLDGDASTSLEVRT